MNNFAVDSKAVPLSTHDSANANGQAQITIDELARAVAQNALLNAEVDQKLAMRLIETREELEATQEALMALRRQFEQFTNGMARVLESIGTNGQPRNR